MKHSILLIFFACLLIACQKETTNPNIQTQTKIYLNEQEPQLLWQVALTPDTTAVFTQDLLWHNNSLFLTSKDQKKDNPTESVQAFNTEGKQLWTWKEYLQFPKNGESVGKIIPTQNNQLLLSSGWDSMHKQEQHYGTVSMSLEVAAI